MTVAAQLAVGAVVVADGCLLLIQRGTAPGMGKWSLPGGRVEPGEPLAAAVERELLEETGLRGECGAPIGCVERVHGAQRFVIIDFEVGAVTGVPRAASDAVAVEFVPLDDVADFDLVEGLGRFLIDHGVLAPQV